MRYRPIHNHTCSCYDVDVTGQCFIVGICKYFIVFNMLNVLKCTSRFLGCAHIIFTSGIPPHVAGPDGSFLSIWACNLEVPGSNPGRGRFYISLLLQSESDVL